MKWRSTALVQGSRQGLHNNAVMGNLQGQRGKVFQGHCIARNIARAALELRHAPLGTRCSAELVRSNSFACATGFRVIWARSC